MVEITSAWPTHPGYAIDLVPWRGTARVWHGDLLVAETTRCLRVEETRHVDRLYSHRDDVRWEHFAPSELRTICPFKGEATYWHLLADDSTVAIENVVWSYPTPFDEVAGIVDHVCFYDDRLRVELDDHWPTDPVGRTVRSRFPIWGDAADLQALIDVQPEGPGRFTSPPHRLATSRNVVEAGHQLAQAVVAGSKTIPHQRVTSVHLICSKSAAFDQPLSLGVEVLRQGRSFSTVEVRVEQAGALRSTALLLMDASPPDTIRHDAPMPDVAGPEDSIPLDMRVTGRDLRVVDGAYDPDPDRIGPPEIFTWCRFRDAPAEASMHAALMAQSTTHWTIAAGMLPHPGVGEAQAHVTLSTGIMATTVSFLDEVDITDWLLYSNRAVYAGRGLIQGEGRVYASDGRVVATYSVQSIVRDFARDPSSLGLDATTAM
jgi:acyl-CoA thioesterase II